MNFIISKEDFINLKKIVELNKRFFSKTKDYVPKIKRAEAKVIQKPVWQKMKDLKNSLLSESYFRDRFDIIVSRPNKQFTETVKGPIRRLVWVSLASLSELNKKGNEKLTHVHIPQLQVSFQPDRLIAASIWLEGNNCKQIYREKLLSFLKRNSLSKKYKLLVYNKENDEKVFEKHFDKLTELEYEKFYNGRNYSIGIALIYKAEELSTVEKKLYSLIISELQYLNEKILIPCFNFQSVDLPKKQKSNIKSNRKEQGKFDTKESIRKAIDQTVITKKHKSIQNNLYDFFKKTFKDTKNVIKMEKDFVDIRIESPNDRTLILYEIKTDKTALNCIKHGIGQLLFYKLMNTSKDWERIELVIVGQHVLTSYEKNFIKSIKEYLGKDIFRYQRFDEKRKVLLDEKNS